ncbi:unnamed protein product [Didymodactylos carnosus]|uniref:Uncharacterized protein n=1 Tax=Didymodactylos carnosus TaxID=1234261 RepID=A0A814X7V6_9BILA|nr:unnamed protein product [Didymodactylos carnosus]CAF3974581.1 unnamed protein product [Didymodactylos carnosus]
MHDSAPPKNQYESYMSTDGVTWHQPSIQKLSPLIRPSIDDDLYGLLEHPGTYKLGIGFVPKNNEIVLLQSCIQLVF